MSGPGEPPSSRICRTATLVKVQAFTGAGAVPCTQTRGKFPVLVRVSAAAEESSAVVGVDIVAVLDVGGAMSRGANKLQRIKDAMKVVVNKLGPDDRLSIVSFDTDVRRLTELTRMSNQGRIAARNMVMGLCANGRANTGPRAAPAALEEGAQILRERRHDEKSSRRVGCVVFLSDGLDTQIMGQASISSDFPVHALALGADHDPKAMKHIADKTSGTYSFANNDLGKVKDACALFTSVPATSVEITLRAHDGALISSDDKTSDGAIRIDNMYAGEKKNFIVFLALQATKERKQKLLTIGGQYQNLSESKNLADTDVSVMRPQEKNSKSKIPHWVEVVARVKLFFMGISGLVPQPSTATTQAITSKLQQIWQHLCKSTEGKFRNAPQTMENFKEGYQNVTRGINDNANKVSGLSLPYKFSWLKSHRNAPQTMENFKEGYQNLTRGISNNANKVSGLLLPYKFSWLKSHKWRRAPTKNEPRSPKTRDFQTPRQETEGIVQVQDGNDHGSNDTTAATSGSTTTTWEKIRARGRNLFHPCSRLLPGAAVVLFLASLLLMLLYPALQGTSMAKSIVPLQYPMLLFSKSNYYAAWDANEAKDPKQDPARKNGQEMGLNAIYKVIPEYIWSLLSGKKTDRHMVPVVWEAAEVTDENSSPGQGCRRDHGDDNATKVISSVAKISDKCGEGHGCDRDTYRESDLVAKILDIIITSVKGKEMELKSLLVEAQYDHE